MSRSRVAMIRAWVLTLACAASPALAGDDTFRLVNGDLVAGTLKGATDLKVAVDSDTLGVQVIDWQDVESFDCRATHNYALIRPRKLNLSGPATLRDGLITVRTDDGEQVFSLSRLKGINEEPEASELDKYFASATLGITANFGNTRQRAMSGLFELRRRYVGDPLRFLLKYQFSYAEAEDVETARLHRGDVELNRDLIRPIYLTPLVGNVTYDKFQNIELRVRAGAGVGALLLEETQLKWSVDLAGSWVRTNFRTVTPGSSNRLEETAIRLATDFYYEVENNFTYTLLYEAYLSADSIGDTVHHLETVLKFELWGDNVLFSIGLIFDRVEQPERDSDGTLPRRNDARLTLGITIDI